jgi:putative ABC transport system permease protein
MHATTRRQAAGVNQSDVRPVQIRMESLIADVRHGLRILRKSPGFTVVVVATIALGIGANTAIFSTVDAVLLRALPYADPDRVVMVWEDASAIGFPRNTPAPANYADWARLNRSFSGVAATRGASASLTGDGVPEQLIGRAVTPNFFPVLGVRPALGRTFTEEEDRARAQVVVISYGLWQRRYGGDPAIVGRGIAMNGTRYDVIGVMPRWFVFRNRDVDYWVPIAFTPQQAAARTSHYLNVVARLAPGVAIDAARDDMRRVDETLQRLYPDANRSLQSVVVPMRDDIVGNTRTELLVLMAAAAAVLLIACANLASLLLSRAVGRRGELAVRSALGATRGRLVRQMIVEATVISAAGGLLGVLLAPAGVGVMAQLTPRGFPPQPSSVLDLRLLAFAAALSAATGVAFSLIPALQAARASLRDALQQGGRAAAGGRGRLTRDGLVVLQVAAALVLLAGAGLMLRTLANLRALDLGFNSDRLLTLRTTLPQTRYADPSTRLAFYDRVIAGVRALPGVEAAAFASNLPFMTAGNTSWLGIDGRPQRPDELRDALLRVGTPSYLATLGVRAVDGRILDERDVAGAPRSVVVNETLARTFFPGRSSLGERLRFGQVDGPLFTIVGVVADVRERGYQLAAKPGVYLSFAQTPDTWALPENLVVRAARRPEDLADAVRRVIAGVDPDQPVAAVRTMDDILDLDVADRQQQMVLLGAFAGLALLLASIGLYGVLSYAVTQRSREFGLRIALGASAASVMRMVVARGLLLTAAGLTIGLALAWAAMRALQNLLYGVSAADPRTFGAVIALLTAIAAVACCLPAWRASHVDPMIALREE